VKDDTKDRPTGTNRRTNRQRFTEFAKYLGVAGVGYSFNVGSRIIYSEQFKFGFATSVTLAYGTGMVVAFALTKLFLFDAKNSGNTTKEAIKFVVVSAAAWAVTLCFALLALQINNYYIQVNPDVHNWVKTNIGALGFAFINRELASHIFGTGFGFVTNFFGHKLITFRNTGIAGKFGR
jgi:putative flippase GtrA